MSSYSVPTMRSISTYLLALLALVFLLPTGCKPDSDVEEATLELSPSTLNFTKDGGEQVVTITTNRENWSAFSPQEDAWVKLKEEGEYPPCERPCQPSWRRAHNFGHRQCWWTAASHRYPSVSW